jgi:hypothetical protein
MGRHADWQAIRTEDVDHLHPPIRNVLISEADEPEFGIGIFTNAYAGRAIGPVLIEALDRFDWLVYFIAVEDAIRALGYPHILTGDWRFTQMRQRVIWLTQREQFPSVQEIFRGDWQLLIDVVPFHEVVWEPTWER